MGGVLEVGKIVTAIWLHRNWKTAPILIKSYLSFATLTLMAITSMGIFGFLSKAHIEHQTTTQKAMASAQVIENKIQRENDFVLRQKEYISALKARSSEKNSNSRIDIDSENQKIKDIIEQMNKDISFDQNRISEQNKKLSELNIEMQSLESSAGGLFSNKKKKIEELKILQEKPRQDISDNIILYNKNIDNFRSESTAKVKEIEDKITSFRNQNNEKDTSIQPQIDDHTLKISDAYGRIDLLEAEKIGFSDNVRQLEAEVGPVKYVAEAIADFTGKEFDIAQAVRIVIIVLVLVFDPLAILLVIAANISIEKYMPKSQPEYKKAKKVLIEIENKIKNKQIEKDNCTKESELSLKLNKENQAKHQKSSIELQQIQSSIADATSNKNTLLEEIKSSEESLEKIKSEIISTKQDRDQEHEDFVQQSEELSALKNQLNLDRQDYESSREQLDSDKDFAFNNLKRAKTELSEVEKQNSELQKKCAIQDKSLKQKSTQLENFDKEIESKKNIIESLEASQKIAEQTSSVIDIFRNTQINEISQNNELGKTLSIKEGNRIHQFVIPEKHIKLSDQYFIEVVNHLSEVDDEDLDFEYSTYVKKFINYDIPKYNVLTI